MPTFDGENLIITLDSGVLEIDVQEDLYEPWKQWVKSGANIRYPLAFRSDGGAPLSSIINQGSYFFLNNVAGWRIKPPEENITVYVTGNLAVEDTALPAVAPTTGAFTAAILGLQPVTQGVTPVMAWQLEQAAFGGCVTIDVVDGVEGTMYPTGTDPQPVNNLADALLIASIRGFEELCVEGDLTIGATESISGFNIDGKGATFNAVKTKIILASGCTTLNTRYRDLQVEGVQGGESHYDGCVIGELLNANGRFDHCRIVGPVTLPSEMGMSHLHACFSGHTQVVWDHNGSEHSCHFIDFNCSILFKNCTNPDAMTLVNCISGSVTIDPTCTAGTYMISGNCTVVNNSGGAMVDTSRVISTASVLAGVKAKTDNLPADTQESLLDTLGIGGENVKWSGIVNDANGNMTQAVITAYTDATLTTIRKKWQVDATYDGTALATYQMKVIP